MEVSLSSLGEGPEGDSEEPTDTEGQEILSSDSMSDHAAPGAETPGEPLGPAERPQPSAEPREPQGEPRGDPEMRGVGFFFKEEVRSEGEMAQRRAALLERQQRRAEELRRRRQSSDLERESRLLPSEKKGGSDSAPSPPATPGRRGDFTRGEYAMRQQLRIMSDLDKVLRQKPTNQGKAAVKKARPRPRSMTREESKLSPVKSIMGSHVSERFSPPSLSLAAMTEDPGNKPPSCPDSPSRLMSPSRLANQNGDKDWEIGSNASSPASLPEYTGPKLFKEPSFKSNKFIIHNALSRCCLAGKVNETQKNKIVEEMEKSSANHFLILFRDSSCQFRGVYTMSPASSSSSATAAAHATSEATEELVRLAGVGPRVISPSLVESIYKYSSDRKQFSALPSRTMSMSVDAFTIPAQLWAGRRGATPTKSATHK